MLRSRELRVSQCLAEDPHARRRRLRLRGFAVLPLAPSVGVYEWLDHTTNMGSWLEAQHKEAHAAGLERFSQKDCAKMLADAIAEDKRQGASAPAVENSGHTARVLARTVAAWQHINDGTKPQLHRFLLEACETADSWFERRLALSRTLAAGSAAGWVAGLGERSPHNILLDVRSAELVHVKLQARRCSGWPQIPRLWRRGGRCRGSGWSAKGRRSCCVHALSAGGGGGGES